MNKPETIVMDKFKPRDYQLEFIRSMENFGYKKAIIVWPRRSGKDICAWNIIIRSAIRTVGSYIYCLPSFSMCRRVLLNSKLHDGSSFMDFIPRKLIAGFNKQEMKITLINGSIIIMIGSDNADQRVVGMSAKGIVISEAALASPVGISYLQPMITASDGFFIAISTPRGHSKFWELYTMALNAEDWYVSKLTVDDTKHVPLERIEADIKSGIMSYELAQQEWWTSFSSTNQGSYYGKYLDKMRLNDQITVVPYEPSLQTYCFMDIGMNDMFTILFVQTTSLTIRIFDYYENHSEGLEHYANIIKSKGYGVVKVYAPHDIRVRELTTGISRLEKLRSLGLDTEVVANLPINDGIEAVRTILPRTYIESKKCSKLVTAIENYTKDYDEAKQVFKDKPKHDRHCFTGDQLVRVTNTGNRKREVQIKNIMVGDYVATPFGYKKVTETHSHRTRLLTDIQISTGLRDQGANHKTITTTKNHEIFTQRGIVKAELLHVGDMLEPCSETRMELWRSVDLRTFPDESFFGFKHKIKVSKKLVKNSLVSIYQSSKKKLPFANLFFVKLYNVIARIANLFDGLLNKHKVLNVLEYRIKDLTKVYDLTVEGDHCYYVNGYLVSNSHANDALRYLAVTSKRLVRGMTAEDLDARYANAMNNRESGFFR